MLWCCSWNFMVASRLNQLRHWNSPNSNQQNVTHLQCSIAVAAATATAATWSHQQQQKKTKSCMHVPVLSSSSQIHTGIRKIRWLEMANHKFIASSSTLWIKMLAHYPIWECVRVWCVFVRCVYIAKYVGS